MRILSRIIFVAILAMAVIIIPLGAATIIIAIELGLLFEALSGMLMLCVYIALSLYEVREFIAETEWERQMLRTEVKHYIDTSGLAYSYNEFYTQNMPDKVAWKTLQSDLFANLPQIKAERMPQDFSVVLPKLWRKRQAWDAERTKRPPYRGEER